MIPRFKPNSFPLQIYIMVPAKQQSSSQVSPHFGGGSPGPGVRRQQILDGLPRCPSTKSNLEREHLLFTGDLFHDIPLFYSMFPSTIGFPIVRLECRRVMPSGKQGCQGPGFSCHEDLHRGQVRVQTSPNKSKHLALLETQYTCSNLTQADTNDEMNRFLPILPVRRPAILPSP